MLARRPRVTLPAPRDELPLLARAGTVLTLLPPDVDTLARTGGRPASSTRPIAPAAAACSRSRAGAAARPSAAARPGPRASCRGGGWRLAVRARRARTYAVQATMSTLRRPLRPRAVLVDGRPLRGSRWRFDARRGVLRATVRLGRRGVLVVRG